MVLSVLLLGMGTAYYEAPRLLQKQMKRELIAFSAFLLIGMALALALALDWPIPNPTRTIEFIFRPLERVIYPQ
jgi:hypothetical protein